MSDKVLFVDDDQKILNGIRRQFEDVLDFETADTPGDALRMIDEGATFGVVVSDMRMPAMNGVQLLAQIKERSPDTVRIMLTGYADLQSTVDAVNEGNIFRFLSKPCTPRVLEKAVSDGLEQYRLVTAERDLLEGTLHGSIKVMSEMLSLVNPTAFGRTSRVQRIAMAVGSEMEMATWDLKIAAMLFPIGFVTVSQAAVEAALSGRPTSSRDAELLKDHASVARRMLEKIPRLERVALIVAYQSAGFGNVEESQEDSVECEIPIEARILKVASDFENALKQTNDVSLALKMLDSRPGQYHPDVVKSLGKALRKGLCQSSQREVSVEHLQNGMVLASDIRGTNGQLMVSAGQEVSDSIRRRLTSLCEGGVINGPFLVEVLGEMEVSEAAVV